MRINETNSDVRGCKINDLGSAQSAGVGVNINTVYNSVDEVSIVNLPPKKRSFIMKSPDKDYVREVVTR